MSEIALRTTERRTANHWRPVGSTIVCCSDSLIRRKWLEICCDLVSPKKRDNYKGIPGWARLCEAWTPELWQAWFDHDRPTFATEEEKRLYFEEDRQIPTKYPLGQLLMDNAFPQQVWAELIEPIGVLADIPLAPESSVRAHNTWLWSEEERKRYFIVVNGDADDEEVESWQTAETRDGDLGIVLPELSPGENYDPSINVVSIWKKRFDYIADPDISGQTMADIADPDKVLHPRFDKPIEAAQMKQPRISDFKGMTV